MKRAKGPTPPNIPNEMSARQVMRHAFWGCVMLIVFTLCGLLWWDSEGGAGGDCGPHKTPISVCSLPPKARHRIPAHPRIAHECQCQCQWDYCHFIDDHPLDPICPLLSEMA